MPMRPCLPALLAACIMAATPGAVAQEKAAKPASKASKTCDPNVVHTGPRGGKYYRTKDCRKVYLKKGR